MLSQGELGNVSCFMHVVAKQMVVANNTKANYSNSNAAHGNKDIF